MGSDPRKPWRQPKKHEGGVNEPSNIQEKIPTPWDSTRIALPYLVPGVSGCGGRLRDIEEDFRVEEVPFYEPSGQGEHLYLWIEKHGQSTTGAIHHLLKHLALPPTAAGFAGRKDTRAITRQWLSFHTPQTPTPGELEGNGIKVLRVERHGNKLRKGHLAGNRFSIVLRGLHLGCEPAPILEHIRTHGFPNYFGDQRMGLNGENPVRGRRLLDHPSRGPRGGEKSRFLINSYQSALFNDLVAQRLGQVGNLTRILAGDLVTLHRNLAMFEVVPMEMASIQQRADLGELSPSALLPGTEAPFAGGKQGEWEHWLMAREGLTTESFRRGVRKHSPKGERRPMRALPSEMSWTMGPEDGEDCLSLDFMLPKGTYATSMLREVMRNDHWSGFRLAPPKEITNRVYREDDRA